jgi:cell division protein FtsW (lipid II flippase)
MHIIVSFFLMVTVFSKGGESFEFLIKSIRLLFYGILFMNLISSIIYSKWASRNWIIVIIIFAIGLVPIIMGFGLSNGG